MRQEHTMDLAEVVQRWSLPCSAKFTPTIFVAWGACLDRPAAGYAL